MDVDTELLISEVEKRQCLWDPSCEEYKNRDIRSKSWHDICEILLENFEEMDSNTRRKWGEYIHYVYCNHLQLHIF